MKNALAADDERFSIQANGGNWLTAWHAPGNTPSGRPHGASGFCVTPEGGVVLISDDGKRWVWPGGRPENNESWEQTFRREMLEETCSIVQDTKLLGFCRSECLSGPEKGLILVRSVWRGDVDLLPWRPRYEIPHRLVVPGRDLFAVMSIDPGWEPIMRRAACEAGLL